MFPITQYSIGPISHYPTQYSDFVLNTGIIDLASSRALMKPSLDVLPHTADDALLPTLCSIPQLGCDKGILES